MKKALPMLLALAMTAALTGCSGSKSAEETTPATEATVAETTISETSEADTTVEESSSSAGEAASDVTVRVGSLKGPTSMGLVHLMDQDAKSESKVDYDFTMAAAADELLGKVVSGDLDIALVPANVSSVLYNKTNGGISVIDVNTLGVLYVASSDDSIKTISDLKGKTLYLTGKGTSPDYVLHYLMSENGLTDADLTLEYKSEAAEVASVLKEQPDAVGLLPQPFVTAACAQNENLKIVLDLTKEWQDVQGESGSQLVTGVTVVRNVFLEEYPDTVKLFLNEHKASADFTKNDPAAAAELIAALGIIEKAPIAQKALPYCNITCITGEDMKAALSGYLQVLFDQDPKAVGGKLPEDGFYYTE